MEVMEKLTVLVGRATRKKRRNRRGGVELEYEQESAEGAKATW